MKLYTHSQLELAFKQGRLKGQADLSPEEKLFPSFTEFAASLSVPEVDEMVYEEVVRKSNILRLKNRKDLTPRAIIGAVARATNEMEGVDGVHYSELILKSQAGREPNKITLPRFVAYYLIYLHTECTYKGIGNIFGMRDHATVLHGTKNVHGWKETDPFISKLLDKTYSILQEQDYHLNKHPRKINQFND